MKKDLVAKKQATTKSKLQKRYEELLKDIETNQMARESLEEGMRTIVPRIQKEIRPLITQRDALFSIRLLRLDKLADELGIDKYSYKWFAEYLAAQTGEMLNRTGFGDGELKNLYEKYSGKKLLADEEAGEMNNFDPTIKKVVNKQQQALMQDAKAIYLRLVKKYHPDREIDEAAKVQKTELIQRVISAYRADDFLALLKLQIEYLEEEEADASYLAENMLKRYTKILQKQLNEIRQEIDYLKYSNMGMFEDFFGLGDKFSERKFKNFKKSLREEINQIQGDLNASKQYEKDWFKEWVKEIKAHRQEMTI